VHPLTLLVLATMPLLMGGCAIPVAVSIASYAADGVLLLTTDKAGSDHLLSLGTGQDCAMWRVVKGREVCSGYKPGEDRDPYRVDYDAPHREVGEGGMVTVYTAARQGGRMLSDVEAKDALRAPPTPTPVQVASAAATSAPAADAVSKPRTAGKTNTRASTSNRKVKAAATSKPKTLAARRPASTVPPAASAAPPPVSEPVAAMTDPPVLSVAAAAPEAWRYATFTTCGGASLRNSSASRLSRARKPMALRVSTVPEPRCGNRKAVGRSW